MYKIIINMAVPRFHPSGVISIIILLVMHFNVSENCTSSKETYQNIQFVTIAKSTYYRNTTLYPIAIKVSFAKIPSLFFDNVEKYLKKFDSYTEPIIKSQVLNGRWIIRNLESSFHGENRPPKITTSKNISAAVITYDILGQNFQDAALAPMNSIMGTTIPKEPSKAGTILNRAVTEMNLLFDKILLEEGKYNQIISGDLTETMLRLLLKSSGNNIDLDAYPAIGIEFLNLVHTDDYIGLYNVFLLSNPTGISQIKSKPFKRYNLKHSKFYLYDGEAVKFRTGIPFNVLTMEILYNRNQMNEIKNPATLRKYLVKTKSNFFSQGIVGDISLDPNSSRYSIDNNGHEIYSPFKELVSNYTMKIGRNFARFLLNKTGITFFNKKKFSNIQGTYYNIFI